jgi:hypothetical protein
LSYPVYPRALGAEAVAAAIAKMSACLLVPSRWGLV